MYLSPRACLVRSGIQPLGHAPIITKIVGVSREINLCFPLKTIVLVIGAALFVQ